MHFGETLSEERFLGCIKTAYESGIRTFVTSDVYGNGKADELLGQALKGIARSTYSLVGMIGHDFYDGQRKGSQGYPRFTDPELRGPEGYDEFVQRATKLSLERCGTDHFDLLMLHNPDDLGYTSEAVWKAMARAKETGLTKQLGMAPGPANGFTLDLLAFFEKFGEIIDWTMLILNPLEPWPSNLLLPACQKHGIKVLTRVVDHGGVFHDDLGALTMFSNPEIIGVIVQKAGSCMAWKKPIKCARSPKSIISDFLSLLASGISAKAPLNVSCRPSSKKQGTALALLKIRSAILEKCLPFVSLLKKSMPSARSAITLAA